MSWYLVRRHVEYVTGGEGNDALCALVEASDCDAVEASEWSSSLGVPTASHGAVFFMTLLVFAALGRPRAEFSSRVDSAYWNVLSTLAVVGVGSSVAFALVSAFAIGAFCIGCAIVHATNLLILATLMTANPLRFVRRAVLGPRDALRIASAFSRRPDLKGARRSMGMALAVAFVAVPFTYALPAFQIHRILSVRLTEYLKASPIDFPIRADSLAKGPEDAPLQLVVFTDFECPHCRRTNEKLERLLASRPEDSVRLVVKHFPLDPECNGLMKRLIDERRIKWQHANACELAAFAQALGARGRFWEAKHDLYLPEKEKDAPPPPTPDEHMRALASRLGVDYEEWRREASAEAVKNAVTRDIEDGMRIGLTAVPVIYVNGRLAPSLDEKDLERLFRAAPRL